MNCSMFRCNRMYYLIFKNIQVKKDSVYFLTFKTFRRSFHSTENSGKTTTKTKNHESNFRILPINIKFVTIQMNEKHLLFRLESHRFH